MSSPRTSSVYSYSKYTEEPGTAHCWGLPRLLQCKYHETSITSVHGWMHTEQKPGLRQVKGTFTSTELKEER